MIRGGQRDFTPAKMKSINQLKSQPNLLNSPCYNAAKQKNILKVLKKNSIKFMNENSDTNNKGYAKPKRKERKLSIHVKRRGKSVNRAIDHRRGRRFKHVLKEQVKRHKIKVLRRTRDQNASSGAFSDDSFDDIEEIFSEPDTQADSIVNKYESKCNENMHNAAKNQYLDTAPINDENILEGEINKEELPSFLFSNKMSKKTNFHDYHIKKIEITPVSNLFMMLDSTKDAGTRSSIIPSILRYIKGGINKTDRRKFWLNISKIEKRVGNGIYK